MDCRAGEEWNFSYVLPQPEGTPVMIVVPTSLQMGWVESPPYFCTATKKHGILQLNIRTCQWDRYQITSLQVTPSVGSPTPAYQKNTPGTRLGLVIPVSQSQLVHTAAAVMTGIRDVFPANDNDNGDDPISEKKLKKLEGQFSTIKTLLGFDFDGKSNTMWP